MLSMIRSIKWRALLIALFAFYVAPLLVLIILSSIPSVFGAEPGQRLPVWQEPFVYVLVWFHVIAPAGAAYLAAKLARQQPLLHGLLIGLIGAVLAVLWVHTDTVVSEAILALLVMLCSLFGGWFWRYRNISQS